MAIECAQYENAFKWKIDLRSTQYNFKAFLKQYSAYTHTHTLFAVWKDKTRAHTNGWRKEGECGRDGKRQSERVGVHSIAIQSKDEP